MPRWMRQKKQEEEEIEAENKNFAKEEGFEFPVKIFPGMGKDRIRKRKLPITRQYKFKIE